jgi:cation transport ATPase
MAMLLSERLFRRALIAIALVGLTLGFVAWTAGRSDLAEWCWVGGTVPVVVGLLISIVRDVLAGRMGVDSVALVSMSGAVVLGEALAGIVIAIMYAGGNVLEDIAGAHAERDLTSLGDRAPRIAHRQVASTIEDIPIEEIAVGDIVFVQSGEVIPVDGIVAGPTAVIDKSDQFRSASASCSNRTMCARSVLNRSSVISLNRGSLQAVRAAAISVQSSGSNALTAAGKK